jgi:hypothetical protein
MPLDVASALVSFIGLSGQVLQGCNYLSDFFADAKDAPATIKGISDHLEVIQPALSTLHATFLDLQAGSDSLSTLQDPTSALKSCEWAITELKAFADRHGGIHISTSTTPQAIPTSSKSFPGRSTLRRGWQRLDVARNANKLKDLAARLERAKSSLQVIQANIGLALARSHKTSMQEMKLAGEQLRDAQSASGQTSAETKDLALALRADMHANLSRITCESQKHSTHLKTVEQCARELRDSSRATEDAIGSLSVDFKGKLDGLPVAMATMVESAVAKALAQHTASGEKAWERPRKTLHQEALDVEEQALAASTNSASQSQSDVSEVPQIVQSCVVPQNHRHGSDHKRGKFAVFALTRGPKRQQRSTSTVNVWFGRIVITTTVTVREDWTGTDRLAPMRLCAKATHVSIFPHIWLLKTGIRIHFGDSNPGIYHPLWDNRLRVFRTHQKGSQVAQAIKHADYLQFRRMLQDRQVTPHDMVDENPLLYCVIRCLRNFIEFNTESFQHLVMIAELLLRSGRDCDSGQFLGMAGAMLMCCWDKDRVDPLLSLIRMTILHSESDPFNMSTFHWLERHSTMPASAHFWSLILAQEEWDLSEFRQSWQKRHGKDSWQYLTSQGMSAHRWAQEQTRRWSRLPSFLRRDKEHCVDEFGEIFMEESWPTLYWRDDKPPFWRSREACQRFFGDFFAKYDWGGLYWESEVPPFWRSREACQEFFGESFVEVSWAVLHWQNEVPPFWYSWKTSETFFGRTFMCMHWPSLLGERSFDYAEGLGAWQWLSTQDCDFKWWQDRMREEWIASMVIRWKAEEEDLRHSRQHCFEQYGTNFVRDELPRLLRDFDGFPEDEITELTQDGPDLVPPNPIPRLARRCGKEFWIYSDESGDDIEADEEDNWETADEG